MKKALILLAAIAVVLLSTHRSNSNWYTPWNVSWDTPKKKLVEWRDYLTPTKVQSYFGWGQEEQPPHQSPVDTFSQHIPRIAQSIVDSSQRIAQGPDLEPDIKNALQLLKLDENLFRKLLKDPYDESLRQKALPDNIPSHKGDQQKAAMNLLVQKLDEEKHRQGPPLTLEDIFPDEPTAQEPDLEPEVKHALQLLNYDENLFREHLADPWGRPMQEKLQRLKNSPSLLSAQEQLALNILLNKDKKYRTKRPRTVEDLELLSDEPAAQEPDLEPEVKHALQLLNYDENLFREHLADPWGRPMQEKLQRLKNSPSLLSAQEQLALNILLNKDKKYRTKRPRTVEDLELLSDEPAAQEPDLEPEVKHALQLLNYDVSLFREDLANPLGGQKLHQLQLKTHLLSTQEQEALDILVNKRRKDVSKQPLTLDDL